MVQRLVGGHQIDLRDIGTGLPVLMLHGFPLDQRSLAYALGPLFERRAGYRRIHVDLPGFGSSAGAPEIAGSGDMLNFVLALIDEIVGDAPLLIVGESWGAYLARGVVVRRQTQIAGLALLCPVIVATHADRDVPRHHQLYEEPGLFDDVEPADVDAFREVAVVANRRSWDYGRTAILPALRAADPEATVRIEARYAFGADVDAVGDPFSGPTLIVAGRQDSVVGYRDALRLLERYPRSTFAILDRAGHNLAGERTDLLLELVGDWLDRVEGR